MLTSKIKEQKLSKYKKKTAPLFLYFEGQLHLYPCDYIYFRVTILMKQYLI